MKEVILYFIPFEVYTYVPVTRDLIENQAHCIFRISSPNSTANLKNTLTKTMPGKFDNRVVRLKIKNLFNDDFFVDIDGGAYVAGEEKRLTPVALNELKMFLKKLKDENPKACKIP